MTTDEIKHLGTLSRLALTDTEAAAFTNEIDAILAYVSAVSAMAGQADKRVGAVSNILRADEVTVTPGSFSTVLLAAAPAREGQFFKVKKIIDQGESS